MVKLIKEYLSLLQFLLYRAQKRQKIKKILKFQKILYQSKSLILLLFCSQRLTSFQQKKRNKSLSDYFFYKILKFFFLKKKNQNFSFFYSEFKLNKKLRNINFIENFQYFYNYSLFLDFHYKQIFLINLILLYDPIKLSYFYFFYNFKKIVLLKTFQYEFFNIIYYFIFLFLQKNSTLFFDVSSKQKYILKNKSILCLFFIGANYPLFFYSRFYYFYYHNNLLDSKKIQYQQNYYFDYLSGKKHQFFFNENKIPLNRNSKVLKNLNNRTLKKPFTCYSSIICSFPFFRQNSGYFSIKLFNNFSFHNSTKKLLQKLKKIQKQILLLIFEPIWEAFFEISLYSNRRGRSLYDVIEFLRLNIKQQPIFLFKTYLTFVNRNFYKTKKYQKRIIDPFLIFFCFFENIFFHGIQKKYQNFYLITKQQILLYQILKIFKQNKKNKISFYKIFFNNKFIILSIQNKIFIKLNKKRLGNNLFLFNLTNIKVNIPSYKHFILQYYTTNYFSYEHKVNISLKYFIHNLKSKNFLVKNFLIFSLCYFFFFKINNMKQRLFLLELKKHCFSFSLQKIFLAFIPIKNVFSRKEELSFSITFKDSNFFVSKNTFLFFYKNKNVFFETKILIKWDNKQFSFYKKTKKNNIILLKKINYQINNLNKKKKIFCLFFCSSKIDRIQSNYKILLKILFYFLYGYYESLNKFLNFSFFYNIFFNFSLYLKEAFVFYKKKYLKKIFFIIHYFCFFEKFISFFKYSFQKKFVAYLLKRNDLEFVWNSFIKYENIIFFFNSNYIFLTSFKTILKKSLIFIRIFLFFYLEKNNSILSSEKFKINLNIKLLNIFFNDLFISYLKIFFYSIMLNTFLKKNLLLFKDEKKKIIIYYNYYYFFFLWSLKLFLIKRKHTYFYDKKNFNGFSFFNFFIYHTKKNKNKKKIFFNCLFFWQFYYIQILLIFEYIQSYSTYYQIWQFRNRKILLWKNKLITKIAQFYFYQSVIFQDIFLILWKFKNFIGIFINFPFLWKKQLLSSLLFKLISTEIITNQYSFIFYKKFIQHQKLKILYYFFIKPSKNKIQKHLFEINNLIKKNYDKNQLYILFKLSKIIKNWCFYYQILTPTRLYKYIDYLTLQILWKWACRRHYQKSKKWIKLKYFYKFNFIYKNLRNNFFKNYFQKFSKNKIVFAYQQKPYFIKNYKNSEEILLKQLYRFSINKISKKIFICLPNHTDIILVKHQLIQNDRSPYDIDFIYWIHRNL